MEQKIKYKKKTYLCILEIMSPQRPNLILTTHIPDRETDIFVFYSFDVKTYLKAKKIRNFV